PDFWRKYVGRLGTVVGIATFGESAPAKDLYQYFGITTERVCKEVRGLLSRQQDRLESKMPAGIVKSSN
ncbi:MAG TPA: hypothetical protein PK702_08400, partial [Burkholderiaceae bacterium]|nr:hypothetical protein [Burkholderiaceae bacterium]